MNREEMIEQIKDLIHDRESFISDDPENSECFRKDKVALEMILEEVENNRICLSGYRESILRKTNSNLGMIEDILLENNKLKEENEQLHKKIDKAIDYLLTATIVDTSNFHQRDCLLRILKGE